MMEVVVFFVALMLLAAAAIYMSRYLFKRALREVVSSFCARGATNPKNAATLEELGLQRNGVLSRMSKLRDYRPYAVGMLNRANIVRQTEEGRLYLSEDELGRSSLKRFAEIE
jgi:hypothetical protein